VNRRFATVLRVTRLSFRVDPARSALLVLLTLVNAATPALLGLSLREVVARAQTHDTTGAVAFAALTAVAFAFIAIGRDVRHNVMLEVSQRVRVLLEQEAFTVSTTLDSVEHLERPEYLDRLTLLRESDIAVSGSGWLLMDSVAAAASLVVTVLLLTTIHPVAILLALLALPSLWLTKRGEQRVHEARLDSAADVRAERHLHKLCIEPGSAKEIKITQAAAYLDAKARQRWQRASDLAVKVRVRAALFGFLGWACFAVGYLAVLAVVVRRALTGAGSAAEVVLMVTLAGQIRGQVGDVVRDLSWLMWSWHGIDQYLWLADHAAAANRDRQATAPLALRDGIELRDVTFTYPGTDRPVLRDVSLRVPAGATVAFVGLNGAGKTTLVKLLCGLYEPDTGSIMVDGEPLHGIRRDAWRARLSAAYQDFARLLVRLGENVGVGNLPLIDDHEAVRRALGRAGRFDATSTLPDDLDTQLGTAFGGVELSLGQWQTLAVARAFMRDTPLLLVLDEPTASLDARAEHLLYERYTEAAASAARAVGGVTLLITHRFSTVQMADLIVVLEQGRIVEQGTHGELMRAGGRYAQAYRTQAEAYR
jgi:ATP-binding cassette subfamily B protein